VLSDWLALYQCRSIARGNKDAVAAHGFFHLDRRGPLEFRE